MTKAAKTHAKISSRNGKGMRERLWWFDVVYPLTVAVILFTSLTYIVYSGKSSSRLSLLAEQKLLEFSLQQGKGRPVQHRDAVLAVSGDATDVRLFGRAPGGIVPDVEIADYARVIETLADAGVPVIFVHLDGEAHPPDEIYYLPLIEALRHAKPLAKVYLATAAANLSRLPDEVAKLATVLEDSTCDEPENVQSNCPYRPEWDDWVIPLVVNTTLGGPSPASSAWLTTLMPSISPAFILNLPDPATLRQLHFRDLLDVSDASLREVLTKNPPKAAFVGADLSGSIAAADAYVRRFLRTVYDPATINVAVSGTPIHVFWAQLAAMTTDRAMVVLPSSGYELAATWLFCFLIIVTTTLFGGSAASGMFTVFMITGPFLNAWAIKHASVYMPLFDCLYFGMSTFIFAGFARLSFTAFQRWRLDAQRRLHTRTADLKGNFISLLSHNLNTPVAKMQGMLALIASLPDLRNNAEALSPIRAAEGDATRLEYAIRSILVASALEERSLSPASRSARALVEEFARTYGASLKRLGVRVVPSLVESDDDELGAEATMIPLAFDVKALVAALAAYAALFARRGKEIEVSMAFRVTPKLPGPDAAAADPAALVLAVRFNSAHGTLDQEALSILTSPTPPKVRSLGAERFYLDLLAGLGRLTREVYGGELVVRGAGDLEVNFVAPGLQLDNS